MEALQYTPPEAIPATLPEVRGRTNELFRNLSPGQLPADLDLALSQVIIEKMSRVKY